MISNWAHLMIKIPACTFPHWDLTLYWHSWLTWQHQFRRCSFNLPTHSLLLQNLSRLASTDTCTHLFSLSTQPVLPILGWHGNISLEIASSKCSGRPKGQPATLSLLMISNCTDLLIQIPAPTFPHWALTLYCHSWLTLQHQFRSCSFNLLWQIQGEMPPTAHFWHKF